MIEFLRTLIHKIHSHPKIDKLLEYIDVNGCDRLRTKGDHLNQIVYHMVFYQAVDDDLKVIYSQIIRHLKFLMLRDSDALQLLNTRDYELIRLTFEKHVARINILTFFPKAFPMKSQTYRMYSQAYYEEIAITHNIESRVAQNFRERFIVSKEDIYNVFEMYCKEDYVQQFEKTKKDLITHEQFVDLFIICVKNDSFRVAILIYTLFMNPIIDFDQAMMDILIDSMKSSPKFHEIKLFLFHQHFDTLSIL